MAQRSGYRRDRLEGTVKALFDPSGFTNPIPEIVEFGTTNLTAT
jgi:hypothetical protein